MQSGCRLFMQSMSTFKAAYQTPKGSAQTDANSLQSELREDSGRNGIVDDGFTMDELTRAKQAIKAWQSKANSLQRRNELLETEILVLKNENELSMTNGDIEDEKEEEEEEEEEGEQGGKDDTDKVDNDKEKEGDEDEEEEIEEEDEEPPLSRKELEEELGYTKEKLAEMTELYEELLQQRNNEMRLRKYGTADNQSSKAKVTELETQIKQLKAKHQEELTRKADELKLVKERADRDRSKTSTLRNELEKVKNENTNLLLDKKKLERNLQKVYSAKQKRLEQTEDSIKQMEVSTLKLKNNRLQKELQKAQTSPPSSIYSSHENLLDSSLSRLHDSGKSGSFIEGLDSIYPQSTDSRERELETEVDSLKEEVQTLHTRLSSESEQTKVMAEHWEQQLTDSEEKVNSLEEQLEKANMEIELLSDELEIAETKVEELTISLENSEAELAEKLKQREDELNEINEALEDAQGQLDGIPSDTVSLQQQVLQLQQELDDTRKTLAETKKQLDKEIIAVSWKNQEIAQLRSKLQE